MNSVTNEADSLEFTNDDEPLLNEGKWVRGVLINKMFVA